jgi:peptide/nickel transport system permease protein
MRARKGGRRQVAQVKSDRDILAPGAGQEGGEPGSGGGVVGRSPRELLLMRFKRDHFAIAGVIALVVFILFAIFAPLLTRLLGPGHEPNSTKFFYDMTQENGLPKGPNLALKFYFGADRAGRDVLVRTLYGLRTSLVIAFFATGIAVVIGVLVGLIGGFFRGKIDTFLSRMTDVVLSLPVLLLALGLASACGATKEGCLGGFLQPGLLLVSYIIGFFSWPYIARIVRGQVLSLREKEFIEASRSQGAGNFRIMLREVLPNVAAPIIVYTTLIIPNNILFEASLSFLGVGVPDTTPSLGRALSDASGIFTVAWWMMLFPGLVLFTITLAFNLVGDGLRDALDPRTARRA